MKTVLSPFPPCIPCDPVVPFSPLGPAGPIPPDAESTPLPFIDKFAPTLIPPNVPDAAVGKE